MAWKCDYRGIAVIHRERQARIAVALSDQQVRQLAQQQGGRSGSRLGSVSRSFCRCSCPVQPSVCPSAIACDNAGM